MKQEKVVLTYGTFDLFHVGHVRLLKRLKDLGDKLLVGVSTDEFNLLKGKRCVMPYEHRSEIVQSLKFVDAVFPEDNWEQKRTDIQRFSVDIFAMGSDWSGKFDDLNDVCNVVYLDRTEGISTTEIKALLSSFDGQRVEELNKIFNLFSQLIKEFR